MKMNAGLAKYLKDAPNKESLLRRSIEILTPVFNHRIEHDETLCTAVSVVRVLGNLAEAMSKQGYGSDPDNDIREFNRRVENGERRPDDLNRILAPLDEDIPTVFGAEKLEDALKFIDMERDRTKLAQRPLRAMIRRIDETYGLTDTPEDQIVAARKAKATRQEGSAYMPIWGIRYQLDDLCGCLGGIRYELTAPPKIETPPEPKPVHAFPIPEETDAHRQRYEWLNAVMRRVVHGTSRRSHARCGVPIANSLRSAAGRLWVCFTVEEEKTLCRITGMGKSIDRIPDRWTDFSVPPEDMAVWEKYVGLSSSAIHFAMQSGLYRDKLKAFLEDVEDTVPPADASCSDSSSEQE